MGCNANNPPFPSEAGPVRWDPSSQHDALVQSLPSVFIDTTTEKTLPTSAHLGLFLRQDLSLSRLDTLYPYLWWAGRQRPARPLHRQVHELGRTIAPTHRPDLHLVWSPRTGRLFVKVLPRYLLCHSFWAAHLCPDADLSACARGLLLSYVWLVRTEADHALARAAGLLPGGDDVTWPAWRAFVDAAVAGVGARAAESLSVDGLAGVHRRFHYGELRVNRLDHACRLMRPFDADALVRGYAGLQPASYGSFFETRFRWIVIVFAFSTTVLSALQVALATRRLGGSAALQGVSSAIAVVSLVVLAVIVFVVGALFVCLFVFYLVENLRKVAVRRQKRRIWLVSESQP